jgi:phosphotransferase system HPr (HPr) family protein
MNLGTLVATPEVTQRIVVINRLGLHARPAIQLSSLVHRFQSEVRVALGTDTADALDVMGLLLLGAERGAVLTFVAQGVDAAEVLQKIAELFNAGFGEP